MIVSVSWDSFVNAFENANGLFNAVEVRIVFVRLRPPSLGPEGHVHVNQVLELVVAKSATDLFVLVRPPESSSKGTR